MVRSAPALQAVVFGPYGAGLDASELASGLAGALLPVVLSVGLLAVASAALRKALLGPPDDFPWAPAGEAPPRARARRTAFGPATMALGVLLLVLPEPGVLLIVLGLLSCELPGRAKLLRWLLRQRSVLRQVNALRARHGRSPLVAPAPHVEDHRPSP